MNRSIVAILSGLLVLTPLVAEAGPILNRIDNQQQRIYGGVRNGSISPQEFRQLERQQRRLEAAQSRATRSGGKLTKAEKYRLKYRLNRSSNNIYRQKYDD